MPRQAMSELWGAVPQVRWPRVDQGIEPEIAEPSVSANAGATLEKTPVESAANDRPSEKQTSERSPLQATRPASSFTRIDSGTDSVSGSAMAAAGNTTDLEEIEFLPGSDDPMTEATPQTVFADPTADQIELLKAALDDDAERAREPRRHAGGAHDVRVRVESMLDRARRLLDLGQLREARYAAKSAHDLGDSARLDYSPDEERPIDLVQRIDGVLKELTESKEVSDTTAAAAVSGLTPEAPRANPGTIPPANVAPADPRTATGGIENETASRQRKEWGYGLGVFRRDRKPVANTPSPQTQAVEPVSPPTVAESAVVRMELETDLDASPQADGAVVQANRSVTLLKGSETATTRGVRQTFDSAAPIAYTPIQQSALQDDSTDTSPKFVSNDSDVEQIQPNLDLNPPDWSPESAESPLEEIQDEQTVPADFEAVKPLTPFRDVAGQPSTNAVESNRIEESRPANQSWTLGLVLFGVCSVIAIFWYRRGAT